MAVSRRQPPPVPHISNMTWEQAKWLLETFLQQSAFARYESLPGPHGATHLGGSDDISGSDTPSSISIGATGSPGTPSRGFAPIDHVHGTSDVDIFNTLGDLETVEINGHTLILIRAPEELKLLSEILLLLKRLEECLLK